jgi:hypothetical protein
MKRTIIALSLSVAPLAAIGVVACGSDAPTNVSAEVGIDDARLELRAAGDLNDVAPNSDLRVTAKTQNVYLVDPSVTPPPDKARVAGHLQFYVDDSSTPPVLVTSRLDVSIRISANLQRGKHQLIGRVHRHDGSPTKAAMAIAFNVATPIAGNMPGDAPPPEQDAGAQLPSDAAAPPQDSGPPRPDGGPWFGLDSGMNLDSATFMDSSNSFEGGMSFDGSFP